LTVGCVECPTAGPAPTGTIRAQKLAARRTARPKEQVMTEQQRPDDDVKGHCNVARRPL
jgi:hypothetical protein